jgi:hypothetical protein
MRLLSPVVLAAAAAVFAQTPKTSPGWQHLSSAAGDFEAPNAGGQQTSATAFDIDKDGLADFVITERTAQPSVVWYRKAGKTWKKYVVDRGPVRPEAGSTFGDVDGDGDLDFISGADGGGEMGNQVWWWENPSPNFDPAKGWTRRAIKKSGGKKHHDMLFADADHDGKPELIFWNQGATALYFAKVPANPKAGEEWPLTLIYSYTNDGEMLQRATAPPFKSINEHEGLAMCDIDLDGKADIVGGGLWFKHQGGGKFAWYPVDESYHFSRSGAGQLVEGGRPEVVLVVGDGVGPLMMYEWVKGTWMPKVLQDGIDNGHSLILLDFDKNGHLDIFLGEMRLNSGNADSKIQILYGDGRGNFRAEVVAEGYDSHESKVADLDGDGKLDILCKPYNHGVPGFHVFLNRKP